MKKKVISIILIGIMAYSVYACGSLASKEADYDEINEPVQEEASESEIVQDKKYPKKQRKHAKIMRYSRQKMIKAQNLST